MVPDIREEFLDGLPVELLALIGEFAYSFERGGDADTLDYGGFNVITRERWIADGKRRERRQVVGHSSEYEPLSDSEIEIAEMEDEMGGPGLDPARLLVNHPPPFVGDEGGMLP